MPRMQTPQRFLVVGQGIDTLIVNTLGTLAWDVRQQLDQLQAQALAERDASKGRRRGKILVETPWQLAGQPLLIRPHGGGNAQWAWLLTCPAATLELGLGTLNGICGRVRLSADFLWRFGYRQAWQHVRSLLESWASLDHGPLTFQVSELHLCVDVAGQEIDQLRRDAFVHRGVVTSWHVHDAQLLELAAQTPGTPDDRPIVDLHIRHGETEGISFSKTAPHSCALYNKPKEIRYKSRDKRWFADIWRRNGWNGEDSIARVEMRYQREVLRELGCEEVEATFEQLDALWAYSTQHWLRHTIPDSHDTNRTRWSTSPWWRVVHAGSFGTPQTAPAQRRRAHAFHEEHILATILGYLESWSAYTAGKVVPTTLDISTVLREVAQRSDTFYAERGSDFYGEVLKKRKRIGFAS
jgi:hypothetical protein